MAESVTILGMTFEQGEVLTSAKMNQLAANVSTITQGINAEAERAKKAEAALQSTINSLRSSLNAAINAERTRAIGAEDILRSKIGTMASDGTTLTIDGVEYTMMKRDESLYKGSYRGDINDLIGAENCGFWNVIENAMSSVSFGDMTYLLVTCDRTGNTFQFQFLGNGGNILQPNGIVGAYVRTRTYNIRTSHWSDWSVIQGDVISSLQATLATQGQKITLQQQQIEAAVLNKEIGNPTPASET